MYNPKVYTFAVVIQTLRRTQGHTGTETMDRNQDPFALRCKLLFSDH